MGLTSLLIANRGEIAIRVIRAAAELGIRTVAVYSEDDAESLHVHKADEARPLRGTGASAYLDIEQLLAAAKDAACEAVHPGYGFLAENATFARRCVESGLTFVGPDAEALALFGDKSEARALAERCGVPILAGTDGPASLDEARAFMASLGDGAAVMVKAVAGGGGRGMRPVLQPHELDEAYARCQSEAQAAFGNGALYVERLIPEARHVEVQVIGDGNAGGGRTGGGGDNSDNNNNNNNNNVSHLGERECSLQRRHQKIVEVAPSPTLSGELRRQLTEAAVRMAAEVGYRSLGTFEFLVGDDGAWAFIEANARLQVEHTVTEEVTGIDLVQAQLRLAGGDSLADLGLLQADIPAPRGYAVQVRVNTERMAADGSAVPTGGTLTAFDPPSGPGIRVDTYGYAGYRTNPRFDSLLAKVIAWTPSADYKDAVGRAYRALCEFRIEGVATNLSFLQALLRHPDVVVNDVTTGFVDRHAAALLAASGEDDHPRRYAAATTNGQESATAATAQPAGHAHAPAEAQAQTAGSAGRGLAGARVDTRDPLAVLAHGKGEGAATGAAAAAPATATLDPSDVVGPDGTQPTRAPMQGTVVSIAVAEGDLVAAGQQLLVMEAMKMEHVIGAATSGEVRLLTVAEGDTIFEGHPLVFIEAREVDAAAQHEHEEIDLDSIRPDLAEVFERHAYGHDQNRPESVARRRKTGQRTARENVEDLCDPGSFVEYGPLVIAAQRRRRSVQDLMEKTPADGLVAGVGRVNGDLFPDDRAQFIAMSYDYTVLAGTQGTLNHLKKDRMFELAAKWKVPVVFFTEGGGGRPGDTDGRGAGLDCLAFSLWGKLSGLVPLVAVNSGRCFAGNAALLGCADVVIATKNSNIGMGGPAMIEGGGLGVFRPEEVGPMDVQVSNGVVDVEVDDEAEAVAVAKKYLSYFQGAVREWSSPDQRLLRRVIPENRLRSYDVRRVIATLADDDSVLELRPRFGVGMITSLIRIEGRPMGVVANNPMHLGGAIDSDGADKAARFMQLCDAFDIPLLFLSDTPGMMVGPEVEKTALVRHCSRMFVVGASVTVPFFTIILRKGYGLGTQAMAGGSYKATDFTVAWPTGEFGGMGLEGAVKLGYRNELAALDDPDERLALYEEMVARMYEHGKAVNTATNFEIDDVIDPADTRRWLVAALRSSPAPLPRAGKKRPCIDTW